jgi:hypothetical protein
MLRRCRIFRPATRDRVAWVRDQGGKPIAETELPFRGREQHHPTVRCWPSPFEDNNEPLATNRWKAERLGRIVVHGGCGAP